MNNSFLTKLKNKWNEDKFLCVGLDSSDFSLLQKVVDDTADIVCAFKPNIAFYEEAGLDGWKTLEDIVKYIKQKYPDVAIIMDAKIADIGNTNTAYGKAIFDKLGADALTVNPYPGKEALQPLLDYKDKGIIVWVAASNPGAVEFQELIVEGKPLFEVIAEHVKTWNTNGNLCVVVGATYPEKLTTVRKIVGDMPILVPGIGAQGGDLKAVLENGLDSNKQGLIIAVSRTILNAENPKEAALKLHQEIVDLIKS